MAEPTKSYVVMEAAGDSPRIQGKYDTFLMCWADMRSFVQDYLDDADIDQRVTLSFTCHEWTRAELEAYCEENGIDPDCIGEE